MWSSLLLVFGMVEVCFIEILFVKCFREFPIPFALRYKIVLHWHIR